MRAYVLRNLFNDEGVETMSYEAGCEVVFGLDPVSHLWVCEYGAHVGWQGSCVLGTIVFFARYQRVLMHTRNLFLRICSVRGEVPGRYVLRRSLMQDLRMEPHWSG